MADGVLFLSLEDTEAGFDWADAIASVERAYREGESPALSPPRILARSPGVWFRALAGISPVGRMMGAKVFGASKSGQVTYLISLMDKETGALRALIDGHYLTAVRTAATSAVAVARMAPDGELNVGILGSGTEAHSHVRAINRVRRFRSIAVFSPRLANREAFAETFSAELGIPVRAVATGREAVEGADLVIAAARSRDESPILYGDWLAPGMVLVSVGSTIPEQREVDWSVIARADLIVADAPGELTEETGDFLAARDAGVDMSAKLVSLADLVAGSVDSRVRAASIRMYKSVGAALQDVAVAEACYDSARRSGLGRDLPVSLSIKHMKRPNI